MSVELLKRRREMMAVGEPVVNPYAGFEIRYFKKNANATEYDTSTTFYSTRVNNDYVAVPYDPNEEYDTPTFYFSPEFPLISGHVYKFSQLVNGCSLGDCAKSCGQVYDSNGSCVTCFQRGGSLVNYKFTAGDNYITVVFCDYVTNIDNLFLYDQTAGEYVHRGANVTADSQ